MADPQDSHLKGDSPTSTLDIVTLLSRVQCSNVVALGYTSYRMQRTFIERRCYKGGLVKRGYNVTGIELRECAKGELPSELATVHTIEQYSSGCTEHKDCIFGHMCITHTGNLLPPHSLSFRSGDIKTQYYIAANKAFSLDRSGYIEALKRTNYGKSGHLRSIMSTPVSGSARLVCASVVGPDPRIVFISPTLASKIVFCFRDVGPSGVPESTYSERSIREGDFVILERAPSLTKYNNQPMRVRFWGNQCLGIHPKVFSYFHGDYDGDEAHIYALSDAGSIQEASEWKVPLDTKLQRGTEYMRRKLGRQYNWDETDGDMKFVSYTTLSFPQIRDRKHFLPLGDLTRNKEEHLNMFSSAMKRNPGTSTFLQDSVKGVKDIMRQQVSQGRIGEMSRVARISAMCFVRGREGGTYVVSRRSRVLLDASTSKTRGIPSVRCVMVLCQASQQAALDAHRVGSVASTGLDMISDLLMGRGYEERNPSCKTLYVLQGMSLDEVKDAFDASFTCFVEDRVVAVAKDDKGSAESMEHVVGCYSPTVLSRIPENRRVDVCSLALRVVYNYYSLRLEGDDLKDLAIAMCYRVQMSNLPITTRPGMLARGLGWAETLMGCDYTKLPMLIGGASGIWSPTSSTLCANFSLT